MEKRINALLFEIGLNEDLLYYKTSYYLEDIKTKNDFNEVVRLLSLEYCDLDRFYID